MRLPWLRGPLPSSAFAAPVCVAMALVAGVASAQVPGVPESPAEQQAPATAPTDEARAEARQRFARAVELYEEGLLEQALEEFRRAYEIAPTPQVLFNLAQVYAGLGRAVESAETLERYQREMGDAISAERREEIETELRRQRGRIAFVTVATSAPGATVVIDGLDRGAPGAEPFPVTSGTVLVEVRAPGYESFATTLRLAGGVRETVSATLEQIRVATGRIRVTSGAEGATVFLDGEEVGLTPLPDSLLVTPGVHAVEVRRPGYRSVSREVDVAAAEQEDVVADFTLDRVDRSTAGTVRFNLPVQPTAVRIDGETVSPADTYTLAPGRHVVEIEVPSRAPYRTRVHAQSLETVEVTPRLRWVDEEARLESARSALRGGWITLGVGVGLWVVAAPFVALLAHGNLELESYLSSCASTMCGWSTPPGLAGWAQTGAGWWAVPSIALGIGTVLNVVGLAVVLAGNNDEQVIRGASVRLSAGLGSLELSGGF